MPANNSTNPAITPERLQRFRQRAAVTRAELAHKPGVDEILAAGQDDGPVAFSDIVQACVGQLKAARESAGLSLADVSDRTDIAVETLSRLENGMATNPTWRTLSRFAVAVGCRLELKAVKA